MQRSGALAAFLYSSSRSWRDVTTLAMRLQESRSLHEEPEMLTDMARCRPDEIATLSRANRFTPLALHQHTLQLRKSHKGPKDCVRSTYQEMLVSLSWFFARRWTADLNCRITYPVHTCGMSNMTDPLRALSDGGGIHLHCFTFWGPLANSIYRVPHFLPLS